MGKQRTTIHRRPDFFDGPRRLSIVYGVRDPAPTGHRDHGTNRAAHPNALAWLSSVTMGVALVIWMAVQAWMIGFGAAIQWTYLALGIAIIATTMVPSLRTSFSVDRRRSNRARRVPGAKHAKS